MKFIYYYYTIIYIFFRSVKRGRKSSNQKLISLAAMRWILMDRPAATGHGTCQLISIKTFFQLQYGHSNELMTGSNQTAQGIPGACEY